MSSLSLRRRLATLASISRCPELGATTSTHIQQIQRLCRSTSTDPLGLAAANTDWMGKYHGFSPLVVSPSTTREVADVVSYCNQERLAIVPQGGNTSLVGGATPVYDEVVMQMKRLNRIIDIDREQGVVICESGCVLEALDQQLQPFGLTVPLDLGSKGSCQIGGNVATNAGGIRLLRYGSMHANVVGLEWVQADGSIVDSITKLRKDNTGYDLKQLLIGSEGSLGVITKVALLVPPRPTTTNLAFVALDSFENVINSMRCAKQHLGEILSAVEYLDRESLEVVLSQTRVPDPLSSKYRFYMIIEAMGCSEDNDSRRMMDFIDEGFKEGFIADGVIAQDATQVKSLWSLRESISESAGRSGRVFKYDVSVPVRRMNALVERVRDRLSDIVDREHICGYGHVGDSNLHLNVVCPSYTERIQNLLEPFVFEAVQEMQGSISAEHGLGLMKAQHIGFSKSPKQIELMHHMKRIFDPNGILNPYKVLPQCQIAQNEVLPTVL